MRVFTLIFAIFLFSGFLYGQEVDSTKEEILSGLDQLEEWLFGREKVISRLQDEVELGQQTVSDMESIQWGQAAYLIQLRSQVDDFFKLDQAKNNYIVLMQNRQKNYRIALTVGIPVGLLVGFAGGLLVYRAVQ